MSALPKFWAASFYLLVVLLALLWGGLLGPHLLQTWAPPIAEVLILAEQASPHIDRALLARRLRELTEGQALWQVDFEKMRAELIKAVGAIEEVRFERLWPQRLLVWLRVRSAKLRWYDPVARRYLWLDERGQPFASAADAAQGSEPLIVAEESALEQAIALYSAIDAELGEVLPVEQVRLSRLGAVTLVLASGLEWRLGQIPSIAAAAQRVRWLRAQWPALMKAFGEPPRWVDLRYERAFAVGLRSRAPGE